MANFFNIPNAVDDAFRRLSDADRGIAYALYADFRRFGTLPDFDSLGDMLYLALKYAISVTPKPRRKKEAEQPQDEFVQPHGELVQPTPTHTAEPALTDEEEDHQSLDQLESIVDRMTRMSKSDKIDAKEALDLIGEAMQYLHDNPEDDEDFDDDEFEEEAEFQETALAS